MKNVLHRPLSTISLLLLLAYQPTLKAESISLCSEEDNNYSLKMQGVNADRAVEFGLKIQEAVREKDLTRLFTLVDSELSNGPRRAFIEGKTFDEVCTEEWRLGILDDPPECVPVGWRGFMLGNGSILYGFNNDMEGRVFSINGCHTEMEPSDHVSMAYAGSELNPWCFTRIWRSGDNYEYFYDEYVKVDDSKHYSKEYNDYKHNIGLYLGKEIPLGSVDSPWADMYGESNTISLASKISECQKELDEAELEELKPNSSYRVVRKISGEYCRKLAPHMEGECLDIALINVTGPLGYSKTDVDTALYGIYEEKEGSAYVVPLVNFEHENEGLNFLDSLERDSTQDAGSADNAEGRENGR